MFKVHYHSEESLSGCLLHIWESCRRGSQNNEEQRTEAKE